MKIVFDRIYINNFLSIGHAELPFRNRGYVSVVGVNNNTEDSASSNGSGKSSIFNALSYALTGKTIQGLSSDLNNIYTNGDMSVELSFSVDKDTYTVTRSRDSKGHPDLKVIVNGVDKSGKGVKESQEILEEYLPDLTNELLGSVIIIGQGMPHKFSALSPSARKEELERLSHNDFMIEDIKNRIDTRVVSLNERKQTLNDTRIQLESELGILRNQKEKLLREKEELDNLNLVEISTNISTLRETITSSITAYNTTNEKITTEEQKLQEINKSIQGILENGNKQLLEEDTKFNTDTQSIKERINNTNKDIALKKSLISSTVCPTCGQPLPHKENLDVDSLNKEIRELETQLTSLTEDYHLREQTHSQTRQDIQVKSMQEKGKLSSTQEELQKEITSLRQAINTYNTSITNHKVELGKLEQQLENIESNKKNNQLSLDSVSKQIDEKEEKLQYNIKELEKVQDHIDAVTRMKNLVARDFRGVLLSGTIEYLNSKCKEYALKIFGNDKLDFVLDGNNINIVYQGKPLENLSGGEQQKVNLIIQFAIRNMMQEFTGFNTNIIVLDEILDNLDGLGCDRVLEFITDELSDIESIFIISHHADSLNICSDDTITIVKNKDGVSSIND